MKPAFRGRLLLLYRLVTTSFDDTVFKQANLSPSCSRFIDSDQPHYTPLGFFPVYNPRQF